MVAVVMAASNIFIVIRGLSPCPGDAGHDSGPQASSILCLSGMAAPPGLRLGGISVGLEGLRDARERQRQGERRESGEATSIRFLLKKKHNYPLLSLHFTNNTADSP